MIVHHELGVLLGKSSDKLSSVPSQPVCRSPVVSERAHTYQDVLCRWSTTCRPWFMTWRHWSCTASWRDHGPHGIDFDRRVSQDKASETSLVEVAWVRLMIVKAFSAKDRLASHATRCGQHCLASWWRRRRKRGLSELWFWPLHAQFFEFHH